MNLNNLSITRNNAYQAQVITPDKLTTSHSLTMRGGTFTSLKKTIILFMLTLMTLSGIIVSTTSAATSASANPLTDWLDRTFCGPTAYFNSPIQSTGGLTALGFSPIDVSFAKKNKNTPQTAYERYGMSGTTWTVYRGEKDLEDQNGKNRPSLGKAAEDARVATRDKQGCVPIISLISTSIANNIFEYTKMATGVGAWIMSKAYDVSFAETLQEAAINLIDGKDGNKGLRDTIFFNFFTLMIFLGAIYLFYQGVIKREGIGASQSLIWMIAASITTSVLMFNPGLLPSISDSLLNTVNKQIMLAVNSSAAETDAEALCYLPDSAKADSKDASEIVMRTASCTFWETFVFVPWSIGQFGDTPYIIGNDFNGKSGTEAPGVKFNGRTINNWAVYQVDNQSITLSETFSAEVGANLMRKQQNWYKIVDAIGAPGGAQDYMNTWSGSDGGSRITVAATSLVGATAGIVVVVIVGFSIIINRIMQQILIFFSTIFFLFGVHPGFGRRMALKWCELYVGALLKIIVLSFLLSMILAFFGAVISSTNNWAINTLVIIALSIAALGFRKELVNMMGQVNFGGGEGFSKNPFERVTSATKAGIGGAALGTLGAAGAMKGAMEIAQAQKGDKPLTATQKFGTGLRVLGKGAGDGLGTGVMNAGGLGRNATLMAGRQAKNSIKSQQNAQMNEIKARAAEQEKNEKNKEKQALQEQKAQTKAANEQQKAQLAAEKERKRLEYEASPEGVAESHRKQLSEKEAAANAARARHQHYAKDYAELGNNKAWQEAFVNKHGFPPPDPSKYRFTGYGMSKEELSKDASSRPVSIEELNRRKAEVEARANAPKPKAPPVNSAVPRPQTTPASQNAYSGNREGFTSTQQNEQMRNHLIQQQKALSVKSNEARALAESIKEARTAGDRATVVQRQRALENLNKEIASAKEDVRLMKQQLGLNGPE